MKTNMKSLFFILALTLRIVRADDKQMISSFMNAYPNSLSFSHGKFTTEGKICICGFNTEVMTPLGQHMEMYKLAQNNWIWEKAANKKEQKVWNNTLIKANFIGSAMWFSPGDSSFASYNIPKAQMKATLEAFHEVLSAAEITATVEDCVINMAYLPVNWYSVVHNKARDTQEKRMEFVEAHGMKDHYWEYWDKKNKYKMAYPQDFAGIKTTWESDKKKQGDALTFENYRKYERNNSIICHITIQHVEDKAPQKANIILVDLNDATTLFYKLGKFLVYANGYEAANMIKKFDEMNKPKSNIMVSNRAFIFQHDLDEMDQSNRDELIDNLILPNTFEYSICTELMNSSGVGKVYNINYETEFPKVFEKYIKNCPMITWKGHMTYSVPDKQAPGGKRCLKKSTLYDKDRSIFVEVSDDLEPQKDLENMKDIIYDSSAIDFKKAEKFDEEMEKVNKGNEDAEQADQDKENEQEKEPVKDTPEPTENPQPSQEEIEQAILDAKKKLEEQNNGEDEDPEGENKDDEDVVDISSAASGVSTTAGMNQDAIDKARSCEERRKEIEELLQDQVPKTKMLTAMFINLMIQHPHVIECSEMVKYNFTFNDDGGTVHNNDPPGVVMHWSVRMVDHQKFDPKNEDPGKVVYEVIFYNHNFEDQKDALYYIPAREIVNEWDKFPYILEDFFVFAETRLGEILNVVTIYDKMKNYVNEQMKIMSSSKGWLIEDANTGPLDLSGNSTANEFAARFSNPNANYIIRFFKLEEPNHRGFYDFVFQCWKIGDKYMMVKINGTQFDYSVLINKYTNEVKLNEIWQGLFSQFDNDFFQDDAVVSLKQIKKIVYHEMEERIKKYKFGFLHNKIPIDQDEYNDPIDGHAFMQENDYTAFMFTFMAEKVDKSVNIRGFIHNRENISVLNLFFSTDMFVSEYIIPLSNYSSFSAYVGDIFEECYMHMFMLLKQISVVENPKITEAKLDEEQNLGRYTMKKLLFKTLEMLSRKIVYGCVAEFQLPKTETKVDADGIPIPAEDEMDAEDEGPQPRQYKWTNEQFDSTGEFLMLRSNYQFIDVKTSQCESDEERNPTLIHLYSTRLDDRNGYALTINSPNFEMNKDIKTTYHFVKYQDYAHMRVFEEFIGKVLNQMFDPAPEKPEDEKTEE